MSCTGIIDGILESVDDILGIRDDIGAVVDTVYFITRTWSGATVGDGTAVDTLVQMLPSPAIVNYSQDIRLMEAGIKDSKDILLKNVSRNAYDEGDLNGRSTADNIEKLFLVGEKVYQVVNVKKNYVTWDILVRELTNQTRY